MHECLRGAVIYAEDHNHGYFLAWFGGHGIHAFDLSGKEVAFWNLRSLGMQHAYADEVEDNMLHHMETGAYMELIER